MCGHADCEKQEEAKGPGRKKREKWWRSAKRRNDRGVKGRIRKKKEQKNSIACCK